VPLGNVTEVLGDAAQGDAAEGDATGTNNGNT
jgi:hypothetical protein